MKAKWNSGYCDLILLNDKALTPKEAVKVGIAKEIYDRDREGGVRVYHGVIVPGIHVREWKPRDLEVLRTAPDGLVGFYTGVLEYRAVGISKLEVVPESSVEEIPITGNKSREERKIELITKTLDVSYVHAPIELMIALAADGYVLPSDSITPISRISARPNPDFPLGWEIFNLTVNKVVVESFGVDELDNPKRIPHSEEGLVIVGYGSTITASALPAFGGLESERRARFSSSSNWLEGIKSLPVWAQEVLKSTWKV